MHEIHRWQVHFWIAKHFRVATDSRKQSITNRELLFLSLVKFPMQISQSNGQRLVYISLLHGLLMVHHAHFLDILQGCRKKGLLVLVLVHDLQFLQGFAGNSIVLFTHGKLCFDIRCALFKLDFLVVCVKLMMHFGRPLSCLIKFIFQLGHAQICFPFVRFRLFWLLCHLYSHLLVLFVGLCGLLLFFSFCLLYDVTRHLDGLVDHCFFLNYQWSEHIFTSRLVPVPIDNTQRCFSQKLDTFLSIVRNLCYRGD